MKLKVYKLTLFLALFICNATIHAQLHTEPKCGNNFNLNWTTSTISEGQYWHPGSLSNTYTNVDNSGTDVTVTFTGETSSLGFWAGQTPKIGTQSSYLYNGIDLLTNGFIGPGITCTISFSKPIYALSFDIHHINDSSSKGDKYTITGTDNNGNTIYPEFTNSSYPTYTSDNNTGIVNAIKNLDAGTNPMVGVNFEDSNFIKSITLLWEDCETCTPNTPHATGIGNFSFCTPQIIDFDGLNDYISTTPLLGGESEITMMSWIKIDNNSDGGEIMGQPNFRMYIDSDKKINAFIKTSSGIELNSIHTLNSILSEDLWYHTALKFNGNTGTASLYLNGEIIWSHTDSTLTGTAINNTENWNSNHDFEIGRNTQFDNNYFEGAIYECRVYKKDLNLNQLHQQINQEIKNNNGNIVGSVVPLAIKGLLWSDLLLYYKMNNVNVGFTKDLSKRGAHGKLNNMSTNQINQEFTAPLPYTTTIVGNGNWQDKNNWIHGSVWDITQNVPDHAIIKINTDLELNKNINTTGLIINNDVTLTVKNDSGLYNSWYLLLNGILNLEGKSQLIQTKNSFLDHFSSGILKTNLQGTADMYTYDYWSSPVGTPNNLTINNSYTLKDIFTNVEFISIGYDGLISPLSIADYWVWKLNNNLSDNYSSWQHVRSNGQITAGEGFTMKGPGTGTLIEKQNYTIQGKPNNGDINLTVNSGNDYLIGNPYPSAIDAVKFIKDNMPSKSGTGAINGTLYFWEHWGGGSHIASEYQGGYATYSLSGSVPAASNNSKNILTSIGNNPIDAPNRYIPVGQGFYTTASNNGVINFNNSQRVFQINEKNEPEAHKSSNYKNKTAQTSDSRLKLRIGFKSVNTIQRQLLLTVDEEATEGNDWGYDSKYIDTQIDDMYWLINNEKYIIQGINKINKETIIPVGIHTKTEGLNRVYIDELENTPNDFKIYLHDKDLNIYHNLKHGNYEIHLASGKYLNRFEITFSKPITLDTEENKNKQIEVYFSNEKNKIVINNPASKLIEHVEMLNILGQTLFKFQTNSNENHLEYNANQIKTGNYILKIDTEFGTISKKVLIK